MQDIKDDDLDDDFYSNVRKIRKTAKQDILDETFKKAEISRRLRPKGSKKSVKKPFLKLGVILIIIAVLAIIIINLLPWIFVKYDSRYGTIQESYYIGFENKEDHYFEEINYIFESPCTNCTNHSSNFIGITQDDFTSVPKTATNAFYALVLLGVIFTIFEIIEKWKKFNSENVTLIHSTFAIASYIIGVFVTYLCIKFLSSYFLLFYNTSFIEASGVSNIVVIYPVVLILLIISFTIIMIATAIMQINFNEFEKKLLSEKTRSGLSSFRFGDKI